MCLVRVCGSETQRSSSFHLKIFGLFLLFSFFSSLFAGKCLPACECEIVSEVRVDSLFFYLRHLCYAGGIIQRLFLRSFIISFISRRCRFGSHIHRIDFAWTGRSSAEPIKKYSLFCLCCIDTSGTSRSFFSYGNRIKGTFGVYLLAIVGLPSKHGAQFFRQSKFLEVPEPSKH